MRNHVDHPVLHSAVLSPRRVLADLVPPDGNAGQRGQVFTRRWVAELVLDLVGFVPDVDLASSLAIEPSCGAGAFLIPMVERFIESCQRFGHDLSDLKTAIHAFDISQPNVDLARRGVAKVLLDTGLSSDAAEEWASNIVRRDDFLLSPEQFEADFVVGNPPYVRLEQVPARLMEAYRAKFPTMRGRADLYVGFIERGLRHLTEGGVLGFVVPDRWMHNQYGHGLRELTTGTFSMETVLSLHDVDAFEERVAAYPSVVAIRRTKQARAVVGRAPKAFGPRDAARFVEWARSSEDSYSREGTEGFRLPGWFDTPKSWPSGHPSNLAIIAELESKFPSLEGDDGSTRVRAGLATGADEIFVTRNPELVEADRLMPLLTTADTANGSSQWSGTYLVNPWDGNDLADLGNYPMLAAYLESHAGVLRQRHVAQRKPEAWYRTIDKIVPGLLQAPKLIVADLKAHINPVLDRGRAYPQNGLYVITSDSWDLEVLGGLLLSDIAELFVRVYCVKMRGGYFRFQAQYLRRIRVPEPGSVDDDDAERLREAFLGRDREDANAVARRVYGLPPALLLA